MWYLFLQEKQRHRCTALFLSLEGKWTSSASQGAEIKCREPSGKSRHRLQLNWPKVFDLWFPLSHLFLSPWRTVDELNLVSPEMNGIFGNNKLDPRFNCLAWWLTAPPRPTARREREARTLSEFYFFPLFSWKCFRGGVGGVDSTCSLQLVHPLQQQPMKVRLAAAFTVIPLLVCRCIKGTMSVYLCLPFPAPTAPRKTNCHIPTQLSGEKHTGISRPKFWSYTCLFFIERPKMNIKLSVFKVLAVIQYHKQTSLQSGRSGFIVGLSTTWIMKVAIPWRCRWTLV